MRRRPYRMKNRKSLRSVGLSDGSLTFDASIRITHEGIYCFTNIETDILVFVFCAEKFWCEKQTMTVRIVPTPQRTTHNNK